MSEPGSGTDPGTAMRELRSGVWYWRSPHPEWKDEEWPQLVSSYAIQLDEEFVLFDPIAANAKVGTARLQPST